MARGVRKAATQKLPEGVRWATQVPILVIPSGGHNAKDDGADGALRNRGTGKPETAIRLRYPPCCDEHKKAIKIEALVTPGELQATCSRFSQHIGHGRLQPGAAHLEWAECTDKVPCEDCLSDYNDKRAA